MNGRQPSLWSASFISPHRLFSFVLLPIMKRSSLHLSYLALALAFTTTQAVSIPHSEIWARQSSCSGNSADDRTVWCDYDISTNYYDTVPDTGVTREYWFELTNTTASPDGVERIILAVNGSIPGPTIIADWGDTVTVHVTNSLSNNGTGLHFHGIRQNW